jgi:hypothetical protein
VWIQTWSARGSIAVAQLSRAACIVMAIPATLHLTLPGPTISPPISMPRNYLVITSGENEREKIDTTTDAHRHAFGIKSLACTHRHVFSLTRCPTRSASSTRTAIHLGHRQHISGCPAINRQLITSSCTLAAYGELSSGKGIKVGSWGEIPRLSGIRSCWLVLRLCGIQEGATRV